jgi:nicotinamidase-related amidase
MQALLIIDMQVGSFESAARSGAEGVIKRINEASRLFRSSCRPVIHIQHDGNKEGFLRKGSPDWEILTGIERGPSDLFIDKEANARLTCFGVIGASSCRRRRARTVTIAEIRLNRLALKPLPVASQT